ncbi:hypothetical protein [Robertmurraya massiliosenegalensis]|uniref:hypothetical protein n=1 Tax=Robertmurraya massiliosenegalensis TaxID=1287657 RepID=UPI000319A0D9|nr:hypothetical protein [Robertmurraya massiliosenegalensis]
MVRIPESDRDIIEKAIYLPMLLIVLERDRQIFEQVPVKLKPPYLSLIEKTMNAIQKDLFRVKKQMRQNNLKVFETRRDDAFTEYKFISKGYEETHTYYNLNMRNRVQKLLDQYLSQPPN